MRRLAGTSLLVLALSLHYPGLQPVRAAYIDDPPQKKAPSGPRVYKGRVIAPVMSAAGGGAEWLERDDRDETEQPDKVIDALEIRPNSVVADVGAGTGYFSIRIAKRLGPEGKVLATDLQPEMLRQLGENIKRAGVKNIQRILATANDAKLPENGVDLALMVDVYHELQDPERTMAQIRKSLKPDGRLVLVEYRAEDPSVPIKPEHKTTLRQIRYEIEPMGFRLKEVFEFLPHQHIEVFLKDDVQGETEIINSNDFPTVRKPGWAGVANSEPYERAGFKSLFNGTDLHGWSNRNEVWQVRSGAIVSKTVEGIPGRPELRTTESFDHFELDLQWRQTSAERAAFVYVRSRHGIELDDGIPHTPDYLKNIAHQRTGEFTPARGGRVPSSDTAKALVHPNEWNRLTVRAIGDRIAIAINGVATGTVDLPSTELAGPISLFSVSGATEFREIWLKPLRDEQ